MNDSYPAKPKRRSYQFSLRTLLIVVLMAISGCGPSKEQQATDAHDRSIANATPTFADAMGPKNPVDRKGGQAMGISDGLRHGEVNINPVDGAEMAWIEGGEFLMGNNSSDLEALMRRYRWDTAWIEHLIDIHIPDMEWSDYALNETPRHRVAVRGFWMYRYEVTAAQYRKFCQATGYSLPPEKEWGFWGRQPDDHPVIGVAWDDAQAYCKWANARLPSEAEWEYAACGSHRTVFPWGDQWDRSKANSASYHVGQDLHSSEQYEPFFSTHYGGTKVMTMPVGSFPADSLGLFDMAGNVSEWCEDQYDRYHGNRTQPPHEHGSFGYARGGRVVRGGWWGSLPCELRCTSRSSLAPGNKSTENGFRCVVSR